MGDKEKSLELKIRRIIYKYILKNPGLHERELSRQLGLALSTLDYHLFYLKKREIIIARTDGHYTLYYATDKIGAKEKKMLSLLRRKVPRRIVIFLLINNSCTHKEICQHLGLAASTTSFHLKKLVEDEVIRRVEQGRKTIFNVLEQDYISDLIITYKKSFLDDAVNKFADTWFELNPQSARKKKEKD